MSSDCVGKPKICRKDGTAWPPITASGVETCGGVLPGMGLREIPASPNLPRRQSTGNVMHFIVDRNAKAIAPQVALADHHQFRALGTRSKFARLPGGYDIKNFKASGVFKPAAFRSDRDPSRSGGPSGRLT
ncbi:hypothetical protein ACVW1C_001049 [Bradyrhizobium sp. USDA 4011]